MTTAFLLFGVLAVAFAILSVTRRNPIYAAFFLLLTMGCLAVEFLILHSPFLAAMQIILYAGAIVVVFVFVIMLLSLKDEELGPEPPQANRIGAAAASLAIFALLSWPALREPSLAARTIDGKFRDVPKVFNVDSVLQHCAQRAGLTAEQLAPSKGELPAPNTQAPATLAAARAQAAYLGTELIPARREEFKSRLQFRDEVSFTAALEDIRRRLATVEAPTASSEDQLLARRITELRKRIELESERFGGIEDFIGFLYSRFVVSFELVSILILSAVAGVIVLARRQGFMGLEGEASGGNFL